MAIISLIIAVSASLLAGLFAVLLSLQDACTGLTFNFLFDFLPISGIGLVLLASTIWARSLVKSKYADEAVAPFAVELGMVHAVGISALLAATMTFFPKATYFYQQVSCSDYGETYFSQVGAPFMIGTWICWVLCIIGFMLFDRRASTI